MITEEDKQAAEQQVLEDAQRRLLEKRLATAHLNPVAPIQRKLEDAIARINALPPKHIAPIASMAGTAVQELRKAAGIPKRHDYEIPDGESGWHEKRALLVKQLGNGFIVAITGIQGTGKSQMSSALIYAATAKNMSCKYAVAMDFFIAIQDNFKDEKKSQAGVIATFVNPKLLVLDEMDERSESAWENRLLFHMINARYNNLVDTLLISRKPELEFLQSLGDSVTSRIQETGGSVVCAWPSYREEKA